MADLLTLGGTPAVVHVDLDVPPERVHRSAHAGADRYLVPVARPAGQTVHVGYARLVHLLDQPATYPRL